MKKLFSLLLVTLMLLSPFAMSVNAESVTEQAVQVKDTNEQKITSDLQAHLDTVDDDEYVPVYVWLNDYGEDMLYEVLSQRLGKTVTADTEEAYIQDKIEVKEKLLSKGLENLAKTKEYKLQSMSQGVMDIRNLTGNTFKAQANLSSIMTDEEIDTCIESNMTSTEIIELSERNQFLSDYRQSRKTVNTAVNNTFYNSLDLDECRNVYLDPALAYASLECKKSYIADVENSIFVKTIGYKYNYIDEVDEVFDVEESTIANDQYFDGYMTSNDSIQHNGSGIRVGVLEVASINDAGTEDDESDDYYQANYNSNNVHLAEKGNSLVYRLDPYLDSSNIRVGISDHSTKVLAILCGNKKQYLGTGSHYGEYFQGIAPNAQVFFTSFKSGNDDSKKEALNYLVLNENVSIVNMSFGSRPKNDSAGNEVENSYGEFDEYIDEYVSQHRVVIVKSAGNNYRTISSPGFSYNVITVGNASTTVDNEKYVMSSNSCYSEGTNSSLANKPDISAFGKYLYILGEDFDKFISMNGTSFAAPQVAGTAALLMQANPKLMGQPDVVKAIILGSADDTAIYTGNDNSVVIEETNETSSNESSNCAVPFLREKSGAGLLNIPAAIKMAQNPLYSPYDIFPTANVAYFEAGRYYFQANTTAKIGIVFEKTLSDLPLRYRFDIQLLDSQNNVIAKTEGTINNVKAFKVTIPETDFYTVRIESVTLSSYSSTIPVNVTTFLTCGECEEKDISTTQTRWESTISCSCGFECEVVHEYLWAPKTVANTLRAEFFIYYSAITTSSSNREFDYFLYDYDVMPLSGTVIQAVQLAYQNVTYEEMRETRTYVYEALVVKNGSAMVVPVGTVTVYIYYYNKTVTLLIE